MFSPFETMMAMRYLRARKAEGFVSVIAAFSFLGILLGVATLIIVMSVMNGFRQELIDRILGLNGHLSVYASSPITDYQDISDNILAVKGVTKVIPQVESQVLMSANNTASGAMVRGITAKDFASKPVLSDGIIQGSIDDFKGTGVAIGSAMAKRLKLLPGDEIMLVSPKVKSSPFGSIPVQRRHTIKIIFEVGMYEYDNGFIFMPLDAAQTFFKTPGGVTDLEIFTENPAKINSIKEAVNLKLPGYYVRDWREANSSFFSALQVERNVMFLILTLIILVAAFNIISSMIMLVKDKSRDIAIMRTMGATRKNMLKIFMLTGASVGISGTLVGAIIGITFSLNIEAMRQWIEKTFDATLFPPEIYFLSQLPAQINWHEVVVVILIAFILSFLATIYPAWRAARMDPVEALRYE